MPYKGVVVGGIPKNLESEDIHGFFKDVGDILEIETYPDSGDDNLVNVYIIFGEPPPEKKSDKPDDAESSSSSSSEVPPVEAASVVPAEPSVIQKVLAYNGKEIQDSKVRIVECPYVVQLFEAKLKTTSLDRLKNKAQSVSKSFKKTTRRVDRKLHLSSGISTAAHATGNAFTSLFKSTSNAFSSFFKKKEEEDEEEEEEEKEEEEDEEKEEKKEKEEKEEEEEEDEEEEEKR